MTQREKSIELFDKLIAEFPHIDRKGKNNPYTSLNGHMFTIISQDGFLGIRLSKIDREEFLLDYKTDLLQNYGVTMKEYVTVPNNLLEKTEELKPYIELSHSYILSLKPKPTTKKKK